MVDGTEGGGRGIRKEHDIERMEGKQRNKRGSSWRKGLSKRGVHGGKDGVKEEVHGGRDAVRRGVNGGRDIERGGVHGGIEGVECMYCRKGDEGVHRRKGEGGGGRGVKGNRNSIIRTEAISQFLWLGP